MNDAMAGYTLRDASRDLQTALRAGQREYHTFAGCFRSTFQRHDTPAGWLGEYSEAYEDAKEIAGTAKEIRVLEAAVEDWEDTSSANAEYTAWNRAKCAQRVQTRLKVYRSTVTAVARRVLDMSGATASEVWDAISGDTPEEPTAGFSALRDHMLRAPHMDGAKIWAEHGGDIENPEKPGQGPDAPKGPETPVRDLSDAEKLAAEIRDLITERLDATAGEAAETALQPILLSAVERLKRKEDASE